MGHGNMVIPKFAERLGSQQGAPRFEDLRERIKRLSEQTLDPYKTYRHQTEERITEFSEKMNQEYPDVLQAESLSADERQERMNAVLKYCCQHFNYYRRHGFLELQGRKTNGKKAVSGSRRSASPALSTPPLTKGVTKRTTQRQAMPRIVTSPSRRVTRSNASQKLVTVKMERASSPSLSPMSPSPVPLPGSPAAPSPVLDQYLTNTPSKTHTVKEELSEPSSTILALPSPPAILTEVPYPGTIKPEPIKCESIKHEPLAVKYEPIKHEPMAVKHELVKREPLTVKHELIKKEPPSGKHEHIKQESLAVKHEHIKLEPPAIKRELIKHEPIKHEPTKQETNLCDRSFDLSEYSRKKEEKVTTPTKSE